MSARSYVWLGLKNSTDEFESCFSFLLSVVCPRNTKMLFKSLSISLYVAMLCLAEWTLVFSVLQIFLFFCYRNEILLILKDFVMDLWSPKLLVID